METKGDKSMSNYSQEGNKIVIDLIEPYTLTATHHMPIAPASSVLTIRPFIRFPIANDACSSRGLIW